MALSPMQHLRKGQELIEEADELLKTDLELKPLLVTAYYTAAQAHFEAAKAIRAIRDPRRCES